MNNYPVLKIELKPAKILLATTVVAIIFALGFLVGTFSYRIPNSLAKLNNSTGNLSPGDLGVFWDTYQKLQQYYINKKLPDNGVLVSGATKGLVDSLGDKYTNYYSKDEWNKIQNIDAGKYVGIGIQLEQSGDYADVENPLPNSPALKAGIKPKDIIISVNGDSMRKVSLGDIATKIRGDEGTTVKLGLQRPSTGEKLDLTITRSQVKSNSIEIKNIANGGEQIIITQFTESSLDLFEQEWNDAVKKVKADNAKYVVIDLRNNTGGWVDAAKYVLEEFLPINTVILKEVDRDNNITVTTTSRDGNLQKIPLAVLVNDGTASASEIVTGTLQDLNRAKVIGVPTIGKGVEQTIVNTSDGGVVFIVFRKWLTSNGRNLTAASPIKPDYVIELSSDNIKNGMDPQLDKAMQTVK